MTSEQKVTAAVLRDEINATWSELKNVIDQHDAEIKAKGAATMETKSLVDALNARLDTLETKMNRPAPAEAANYDQPSASEKKAAFFKMMRKGDRRLTPMEFKALVEDATGEILVPEDLEKEVLRALPHLTVVRNLADIRSTTSDRVNVRSLAEVAVGWGKIEVTGGAMTSTSPVPSQIYIYPEDLYAMAQVGEDELADTDVNLESIIADSFARAIAYAEDKAFMVGTGHGNYQPAGMLDTTGAITAVNTKQNGAVTADDFMNLVYAVPSQYRNNGSFIVNSQTELAIRLLKDGKGQYLWQPSVQAGRPNTFLGKPIYNEEDCPNIPGAGTSAKVAVFGDIKAGYRIVDRSGMTLTRLNERYAELALVGFRVHKRVGGAVVRADAMRTLNVIA